MMVICDPVLRGTKSILTLTTKNLVYRLAALALPVATAAVIYRDIMIIISIN